MYICIDIQSEHNNVILKVKLKVKVKVKVQQSHYRPGKALRV
jgi:hypothetical protein